MLQMNLSVSCSVMSDYLPSHGLYSPWNSLGQNTGVGSLSLFQEIFPTQGLNTGLPHCRQILYQLSHLGSQTNSDIKFNCEVGQPIIFILNNNYNCIFKS